MVIKKKQKKKQTIVYYFYNFWTLKNQNVIDEGVVRCNVLISKGLKIKLIEYLAHVPH